MTENIIYLALSVALIVLGFVLDWLRKIHPEWFAPKEKSQSRSTPQARPPCAEAPSAPSGAVSADGKDTKKETVPCRAPEPQKTGSPISDSPCPRCGGVYRNFYCGFKLVRVFDDGLGMLYQCPICQKYWDYDVTYDKSREADAAAVTRMLSDT